MTRRLLAWLEARFNLTEMFSLLTSFGLFPAEVDSRRPVREALDEALRSPLPSYARWPRVLGVLSFILFAFVALTGMLLMFYYQPTATDAFASVTMIVRDVNFGWFVHQTHRWGAQVLLLILVLRLLRFFYQGLYAPPREAIWVVAVLALLVAAHADLTGRLLLWDARGYWTTVRAMELVYILPGLGALCAALGGGTDIDSLVLTRFYVLHTTILPIVLFVLFYLHFSSVRRVGLSALPEPGRSGRAGLKAEIYNLMILTIVIFGGLITLASLLPEPYGVPADPFTTPPGARPPWYLWAAHGLVESFPAIVPRTVRGLVLEAVLAVVILLPFLDRSPGRSARGRRMVIAAGTAAVLIVLVFAFIGYRMEGGP